MTIVESVFVEAPKLDFVCVGVHGQGKVGEIRYRTRNEGKFEGGFRIEVVDSINTSSS